MAIFESAVMRDVVHMSQVTVAAPCVYHQYQMAANQPLLQVIGWVGHELLQLAHFRSQSAAWPALWGPSEMPESQTAPRDVC